MRLVKVHLSGYRRFSERTTIVTDGKLTAIIGPNESGKSSVLKAIATISKDNALSVEDLTSHSGSRFVSESPVIVAVFSLDSSDFSHPSNLGPKLPRWLEVRKFGDGNYEVEIIPIIETAPLRRKDAFKIISELLIEIEKLENSKKDISNLNELIELTKSKNFISLLEITSKQTGPRLDDAKALIDTLKLLIDLLGNSEVRRLIDLRRPSETHKQGALSKLKRYLDLLQSYIDTTQIITLSLSNNIPKFINFDTNYLNLPDSININDINRPSAIQNLFIMADSSFEEISSLFKENKTRLRSKLRQVGEFITGVMKDQWHQTTVGIEFHLEGENIIIHVYDYNSRDLSLISSRSDGLKQFVALIAFLHRHSKDGGAVALLIDEIETHLHFEAQADLIKLLTSQHIANQIIYTTHSPGALPEDLSAVRAVETNIESSTSYINNRLWSNNLDGVNTMFLAMGAKTFAFSAARRAVITEGESDFMLYPCIFRQVTKKDSLGIQFLPGFSQKNDPQLFSRQAAQVAFLFDGDVPGKAYKAIVDRHLSPEKSFVLEDGYVLEDYLDGNAYIEAISIEINRSNGVNYTIDRANLADTNRPEQLRQWCNNSNIAIPSKRAIADRILDMSIEGREVFNQDKKVFLNELINSIELSFD